MDQRQALQAELKVAKLLNQYGRSARVTQYSSPFDLLVDGWRIELKSSEPRGQNVEWNFNIHRHGILNEVNVDFYILRLEKVPGSKAAVHLLFKSPVKTPTIRISFRSVINKYYKN